MSDLPLEAVDQAPVESYDHLAGQDQPRAVSESAVSEIDSTVAKSESPPDYITYMRERSQENGGHSNMSYVIDNPVFDPKNEPPPPSYSDVVPSDSTADKNTFAESPPEHRTVVDITMDPLYLTL